MFDFKQWQKGMRNWKWNWDWDNIPQIPTELEKVLVDRLRFEADEIGLYEELLKVDVQIVKAALWYQHQTEPTPMLDFALPPDDDGMYRQVDEWVKRNVTHSMPTIAALDAITRLDVPILEIGAGRGYWASLLDDRDADIIATDPSVWNRYYHPVERLDALTAIKAYPGRALMVVWPMYGDEPENDWQAQTLKEYNPELLIVGGEYAGGCTGTEDFHDYIGNHYEQLADYELISWHGVQDYLRILKRVN